MNNFLEGLNSRFDTREEKISDLEVRAKKLSRKGKKMVGKGVSVPYRTISSSLLYLQSG